MLRSFLSTLMETTKVATLAYKWNPNSRTLKVKFWKRKLWLSIP
ncbi:hypothetical protein L915_19443 [Phytophthora nicotianae]|uniref:Uncharacterized protein n=1 Tax=Phytophthora nicotianae TaxID=4792 RepID=W2FUM7_PHYNI|nr:hypothetical protein L915_19443 [Phytophthora nicotianae]